MFKLPELDYQYDALEPYIDALTMEIHHTKHHAGYVKKLNAALDGQDNLLDKSAEDLLKNIKDVPKDIRQSVINNAGGHVNHSLFWKMLSPDGGGEPEGKLMEAIENGFGSFEKFRQEFDAKAGSLFGSGWVFLIISDGKLSIKRHSFQNSPLMDGNTPILGLDVWEHAYYLNYQNRKAEYIDAFWNLVNRDYVQSIYEESS